MDLHIQKKKREGGHANTNHLRRLHHHWMSTHHYYHHCQGSQKLGTQHFGFRGDTNWIESNWTWLLVTISPFDFPLSLTDRHTHSRTHRALLLKFLVVFDSNSPNISKTSPNHLLTPKPIEVYIMREWLDGLDGGLSHMPKLQQERVWSRMEGDGEFWSSPRLVPWMTDGLVCLAQATSPASTARVDVCDSNIPNIQASKHPSIQALLTAQTSNTPNIQTSKHPNIYHCSHTCWYDSNTHPNIALISVEVFITFYDSNLSPVRWGRSTALDAPRYYSLLNGY